MKKLILILILIAVFTPQQGKTQNFSVIRDTEIERYMDEWFAPVLRSAGLSKDAVKLILVSDENINAFVAGGSNMFFFTGLLTKTENVGEVIGVFAHELGHITGGHLVRSREAAVQSQTKAVVSTLIGLGAAILGGADSAGAAVLGGQALGTSSYLAHSRIQESSADQAALTFLNAAALNPEGFRSFLKKLEDQELLPASQQTEYVRTHPITANRIENVSLRIEQSPHRNKAFPEEAQEQHARMKAKLVGFITPDRVIYDYPEKDSSIAAKYARSIAAYRKNDFDRALRILDDLIQQEPKNAYFYEFLGQVYRDKGDISRAVKYFSIADTLVKDAPLIKMSLAHAYLEDGESKKSVLEAIEILKETIRLEPNLSHAYRLLATAYGRIGDKAQAKLYLAEEGVRKGDYDYARRQVEIALDDLQEGTPDYYRAKDLFLVIKQEQHKEGK